MPRRGDQKRRPPVGDVTDTEGFRVLIDAYLLHLLVSNRSPYTVRSRRAALDDLLLWLKERDVRRPKEVSKPILDRYQRALFYSRKKDGQPLSFSTQNVRLLSIKTFFAWLLKENHLPSDPASALSLPKVEKRLPKHLLGEKDVEKILSMPDPASVLGLRDRAILETLYSTGMRRSELIGLSLFDLDFDRGTVTIRQGKGKKDRVVPIGDRALVWIGRWLHGVRSSFVLAPDGGTLFLTKTGQPFVPDHLSQIVREYVTASGISKKGSCHLFRHATATLMLENGADVRYVQEMLGHARLDTTQIYTHVSITKLKQIHTATHPGAKVKPKGEPSQGEARSHELEAEEDGETGGE